MAQQAGRIRRLITRDRRFPAASVSRPSPAFRRAGSSRALRPMRSRARTDPGCTLRRGSVPHRACADPPQTFPRSARSTSWPSPSARASCSRPAAFTPFERQVAGRGRAEGRRGKAGRPAGTPAPGSVHGDHLDEIGVASAAGFAPAVPRRTARPGDGSGRARRPAVGAGLLEQPARCSRSVRAASAGPSGRQQPGRQRKSLEQTPQHGQDALALPAPGSPGTARLPGGLVAIELVEAAQSRPSRPARAAQAAAIVRPRRPARRISAARAWNTDSRRDSGDTRYPCAPRAPTDGVSAPACGYDQHRHVGRAITRETVRPGKAGPACWPIRSRCTISLAHTSAMVCR